MVLAEVIRIERGTVAGVFEKRERRVVFFGSQ